MSKAPVTPALSRGWKNWNWTWRPNRDAFSRSRRPTTRRPPRYANPGLEHNGKELDFTKGEYGPDLVNDFAIDFVTRHKSKPFFLYYPMMLTHNPYDPTPDSAEYSEKGGKSASRVGRPNHQA